MLIKIGYKKVPVRPLTREHGDAHAAFGLYSDHGVIYVDDTVNAALQGETLVHELLHAIAAERDLFTDKTVEERAVTGFANGLCAVLVDNPTLFKTIVEALEGKKLKLHA